MQNNAKKFSKLRGSIRFIPRDTHTKLVISRTLSKTLFLFKLKLYYALLIYPLNPVNHKLNKVINEDWI